MTLSYQKVWRVLGLSINYATMLPRCLYEWNMQCEILRLFFNILGDKMVTPNWTPTPCFFHCKIIVNYGEEELLDDNIINPILILQSSFFDHRSTLGHQGTAIAKLLPNFFILHPLVPTLISMDVVVTSFNTPYSYWPPSGISTNENRHFMWMEIKLPIPCFQNCCTH